MAKMINNLKDLCDYFCADEPAELNRRIYKDTACGASISVCVSSDGGSAVQWVHNGDDLWRELTIATPLLAFTIQTIVEGSDATVDSAPFNIPCSTTEIDRWMTEMEDEASALWKQANTLLYAVSGQGIDALVRENWGDLEVEEGELTTEQQQLLLRLIREADFPRQDFEREGLSFRLIDEEIW